MSQLQGECGVCGAKTGQGARMSRVVIEGRTLELCRTHAANVLAEMPETFEELRAMFVGVALDVDAMIRLGTMIERRSPIPRRDDDDRRVFPPRLEGRRMATGRRAAD
ncbi:MAG TPA: hypothetical protein VGM56_08650 [Byssovorax sp.]|jgi:hypothetical protein